MDNNSASIFDLLPIIAHNAGDHEFPPVSVSRADDVSEVQPRPISKRRGKKRSSRACGSCRLRKVRCNIVPHGAPCSNCRHDEIECVVPLSRRQKAVQERALQKDGLLAVHSSVSDVERPSQSGRVTQTNCSQEADGPAMSLAHPVTDISDHPLAEVLPTNSLSQCHTPSARDTGPSSSRRRAVPKFQICRPLATVPLPTTTPTFVLESDVPALPQAFAPFPSHIDITDISYLYRRDALTLPSERLQIALLKSYIQFMHPSMPILDLEDFLGLVKWGGQNGNGEGKLDLLLFQAVMFAGVEFVSLRILREEGYGGRDSARRALWGRVRLLYDFDITADRHTIIQSLLLASLYNPPKHNSKDHKNASHYLNLAISLCFSLGINRNLNSPPARHSFHLRRRRMERRMWWCVFIRDRVLAMEHLETGAAHNGIMIRNSDCGIEMLKLEDFDTDEGEDCEGEDDDDSDGLWTSRYRARKDAEALIEKARICWWSTDDWSSITRCPGRKMGDVGVSSALIPGHLLDSHQHRQRQHNQPHQSSYPDIQGQAISKVLPGQSHYSLFHQDSVNHKNLGLDVESHQHQHQPIMDHTDFVDFTVSSPSLESSSCATPPQDDPFRNIRGANDLDIIMDDDVQEQAAVNKSRGKFEGGCINEPGHGFGVEGQYDDYFEYFKVDLGTCDANTVGRGKGKETLGRANSSIWV